METSRAFVLHSKIWVHLRSSTESLLPTQLRVGSRYLRSLRVTLDRSLKLFSSHRFIRLLKIHYRSHFVFQKMKQKKKLKRLQHELLMKGFSMRSTVTNTLRVNSDVDSSLFTR